MRDSRMPRKHSRETSNRRRDDDSKKTISESHYYKSVVKKSNHHKEIIEEQKSRRKAKDSFSRHDNHSDRHKQQEKKHKEISAPLQRSRHQNLPDELLRSGSRKTESGSNESEEENQHKHKHRKHDTQKVESYEELSRRKQRIESELQALDMEEAAQKQAESKRSRREVNEQHKSRHTSKKSVSRNPPTVHIKEEPVSDEAQEYSKRRPERSPEAGRRQKRRRVASRSPNDDKDWGKGNEESKKWEKPVEKPNFAVSGKLAEDTNTYNGVVIKYNEPSEARKPRRKWRLYPFKGDSSLPFIPVHRQSAYLFGRTRLIADIPIDHPSCSKQHAVLQFRLVSYKRDDGSTGKRVRPYIIDLESSNGTFVNNKKIEPRRYMELIEKDVVKFGFSSREYVVLHEESKNDCEDDDVTEDKSE